MVWFNVGTAVVSAACTVDLHRVGPGPLISPVRQNPCCLNLALSDAKSPCKMKIANKYRWRSVGLYCTGMAADYLPRISPENCHYPFTYNGGLYHGCTENIENVTSTCERWGCFQVNYSAAICATNIGKVSFRIGLWSV